MLDDSESTERFDMPGRPLLAILLLVGICVGALAGCSDQGSKPYIAVVGDTSGPNSNFGKQLYLAAEFARNEYRNLAGRLETRFFDDKSDRVRAREVALQIVSDPNAVAVVGHSTSSTTKAAQELYARYGIPLLAPIATYTELTQHREGSGDSIVARLVPSNEQQATLIADVISGGIEGDTTGVEQPTVLLYYEPSEYGVDLHREIRAALRDSNLVSIPSIIDTTTSGTIDIQGLIQTITSTQNPLAIVIAGYYHQARTMVPAILSSFEEPPVVILTDGAFDEGLFRQRLGVRRGELYVAFVAPDWKRIPEDRGLAPSWARTERLEKFFEFYERVGGPSDAAYAPIAVDGIALVYNLAADQRSLLDSADRLRRLVKGAINEEAKSFNAYFREYNFTASGELRNGTAYLYRVKSDSEGDYRFEQSRASNWGER